MKKITFLVNDLTSLGGATKVTYELANEFSNTNDVQLIGLFKSETNLPYELKDNIDTKTLYTKKIKIYEISTYRKCLKKLKVKPIIELIFQLIHLFFYYSHAKKTLTKCIRENEIIIIPEIYGLLFLNKKQLNKNKILLQLHNTFDLIYHNKLNMWVINRYKENLERLVVLTCADKEKFEKIGFHSVVQIYNSISRPLLSKAKSNVDILFLGRLDERKGVEFIVPIYESIKTNNFNVRLNVYGDGPLFNTLKHQIREEGYDESIILHGKTNQIKDIFECSMCLILPSKVEGLPMVMLESLSYGVPVVSFECFSGIYEIIEDDVNGYIVPYSDVVKFGDKITSLISHPHKLDEMKKNAYDSAKKFDKKIIIKQWNELLDVVEGDYIG